MLFTDQDDLTRVEEEGYYFQVHNDHTNQRLWVFDYRVYDHVAFAAHLSQHAYAQEFSKIIIPSREEDTAPLAAAGFFGEGRAEGFFRGHDAHFLVLYLQPERQESPLLAEELEMLAEIQQRPRKKLSAPDPGFRFRTATTGDIPELAWLFGTVFSSYPTPVNDPAYLKLSMEMGTLFLVATANDQIVGVAAAEVNRVQKHAEMTECATLPDYRGQGLASHLLLELEKVCVQHGYRCLYSLSRAGTFGMNLVFHRLGYRHGGTLINNAHIGGRFEDLHLWVKYEDEEFKKQHHE